MNAKLKAFGWLVALGLVVSGVAVNWGEPIAGYAGQVWSSITPVQTPARAVIIHETAASKPLSQAMVEVLAKAPGLGIAVWDKDVLGPGRKPSEEAKPFLVAAEGKPLPQLVLQWPSGSLTSKACPETLALLKKEVGK